jgi:mRNA interferase RelE/StbE
MDTGWKVNLLPSASRELDQLDDSVREQAIQCIVDLAEDPFPAGSIPLRGHQHVYRIRFYRDQYRVVYRISEVKRRVLVLRVRRRGIAYVGL